MEIDIKGRGPEFDSIILDRELIPIPVFGPQDWLGEIVFDR